MKWAHYRYSLTKLANFIDDFDFIGVLSWAMSLDLQIVAWPIYQLQNPPCVLWSTFLHFI